MRRIRSVTASRRHERHLQEAAQATTLIRSKQCRVWHCPAVVRQHLPRRQRQLHVSHTRLPRPNDAESGDRDWSRLGRASVNHCIRLGKNQHRVVAAEAERVAHHMCERCWLQCAHRRDSDRGIDGREAGIGRHGLSQQRFHTKHGFDGATGRKSVAEKSFGTGKRRHAIAEQRLQRLRFSEVVVARAGAVSIDVLNGGRIQIRAAQGGSHRRQRARALGMRRGRMMGIAARAPPAEPRQNLRATFQGVLLRLEHEETRAFAQRHSTPADIERPATSRIHQEQRVKSAPRHLRQ